MGLWIRDNLLRRYVRPPIIYAYNFQFVHAEKMSDSLIIECSDA